MTTAAAEDTTDLGGDGEAAATTPSSSTSTSEGIITKRRRVGVGSSQQQQEHRRRGQSWFQQLGQHINLCNGGYVHPQLYFCDQRRQLTVADRNVDGNDDGDGSIPCGTVLFRIPFESMITYDLSIQICPWLCQSSHPSSSSALYNHPYEDLAIAVALASCLGELDAEKDSSNNKNNNLTKKEDVDDVRIQNGCKQARHRECCRLAKLYLQSLPPTSSSSSFKYSSAPSYYDMVPRRWPDDTLQDLLGGSSIFHRIRKSRSEVQHDYDTLYQRFSSYTKLNSSVNSNNKRIAPLAFPTFDRFDDMLVAVTSRAFQLVEGTSSPSSSSIAMVPLLDLGDHCRGRQNYKKNISYAMIDVAAPTTTSTTSSMLQVTSIEQITAGQALRLTYGAQGNAQLLLNYGFCIRNNIEPDGSSNDTMEFLLNTTTSKEQKETTTTPVLLRTGPKSYTYGSFVEALGCFFHTVDSIQLSRKSAWNSRAITNGKAPKELASLFTGHHKTDDDRHVEFSENSESRDHIKAFLNSCEEENEDFDDEDDDYDCELNEMIYGALEIPSVAKEKQNKSSDDDRASSISEIQALEDFQEELLAAIKNYSLSGDSLQKALNAGTFSSDEDRRRYYAAILCESEIRTLGFYILATEKLLLKLGTVKSKEENVISHTQFFQPEYRDLIDKQVDELIHAYMTIRHG